VIGYLRMSMPKSALETLRDPSKASQGDMAFGLRRPVIWTDETTVRPLVDLREHYGRIEVC